jgi:aerobic carbon-monoxide dehydrogenase medium subunit
MTPFKLIEPATIHEAASELGRLGENARAYAGGVSLLPLMRQGFVQAEYLVNVKALPDMDGIQWDGLRLRIGAAVTHRSLEASSTVREYFPLLAEAERHVGNIRVRAQGTLGGNLCMADPHADPGTALLVHEATVTLTSVSGSRELALDRFLRGDFETALDPGELLVGVEAEPLPAGWGSSFGRLEHSYYPTMNVAAAVLLADGRIAGARLAAGCIGPRPRRLTQLERALEGLAPDEGGRLMREGEGSFYESLEPVEDLLGSIEYKVHTTRALLARALEQATNG